MSGKGSEMRRRMQRHEDFRQVVERLQAYQPPQDFEPLMVEYRVATPILMGYPYIFGDAMLARLLMEDLLGDEFYNLPAKSPLPIWNLLKLPVKRTGDIYHASCSMFDTDERHTVTLYKRFHEAADLKTKSRIRMNSGTFRNFMLKFPYKPVVVPDEKGDIPAYGVRFFFNGDLKEIERLMSTVGHIGKKRAQGGGEVSHFFIRPMEHDWSIVKDGISMRSIPTKMLKSFGDMRCMLMAYRFPSWANENICMCVAPGGKVKI